MSCRPALTRCPEIHRKLRRVKRRAFSAESKNGLGNWCARYWACGRPLLRSKLVGYVLRFMRRHRTCDTRFRKRRPRVLCLHLRRSGLLNFVPMGFAEFR